MAAAGSETAGTPNDHDDGLLSLSEPDGWAQAMPETATLQHLLYDHRR